MNTAVPKYVGFEIEVGNHMAGKPEVDAAATAGILCRAHGEMFGPGEGYQDGMADQSGLVEFSGSHQFRVYVDHGHAEFSSPMAPSALDLLRLQDRAVEIIRRCQVRAGKEHGAIRVHLNTTNRFGCAWAFHLNVLLSRMSFDSWRDRKWDPLMDQWLPFLVTSPILFGTGKLGAENGQTATEYQLSQRADFISDVYHESTVERKALINERDEALADRSRYARFHIAAGFDLNLCPFATWLKFGVTQVLLALIEARATLPSLRMADPLAVLAQVSRDLELRHRYLLADGSELTALDIQEKLARSACEAVSRGAVGEDTVLDTSNIVGCWIQTLDQLRRHEPGLRRRIDWIVRWSFLNAFRRSHGLSWRADPLLVADLGFTELGGGFECLRKGKEIDEIEDFVPHDRLGEIRTSQRDVARARIAERFHSAIVDINWHYVVVRVNGRSGPERLYRIRLDDPLNAEEVLRSLARFERLEDLVSDLSEDCCWPVVPTTVCDHL